MSIDPIVDELDRQRAEQMESHHFDFEGFSGISRSRRG